MLSHRHIPCDQQRGIVCIHVCLPLYLHPTKHAWAWSFFRNMITDRVQKAFRFVYRKWLDFLTNSACIKACSLETSCCPASCCLQHAPRSTRPGRPEPLRGTCAGPTPQATEAPSAAVHARIGRPAAHLACPRRRCPNPTLPFQLSTRRRLSALRHYQLGPDPLAPHQSTSTHAPPPSPGLDPLSGSPSASTSSRLLSGRRRFPRPFVQNPIVFCKPIFGPLKFLEAH
jgi:hypothetical protein